MMCKEFGTIQPKHLIDISHELFLYAIYCIWRLNAVVEDNWIFLHMNNGKKQPVMQCSLIEKQLLAIIK